MKRLAFRAAITLTLSLLPTVAGAQAQAPTQPPLGGTRASCVEHIPEGATRPEITDTLPEEAYAGYAAELTIVVEHGKGETVLPDGFNLQSTSDAALALERSGFVIADPDGGSGLKITKKQGENTDETTLVIPVVPLPRDPGRQQLTLPPLPIALARANGEIMTLCTAPHTVTALDPTGNEADPGPELNPEARPQREEWVLAKQVFYGVLAGIVVGILIALLIRQHLRRPKPKPIPKRKLPWIEALEELSALSESDLLVDGKTDEYFDRVSDCIRKYLGARYGFDGLESTSDEMRRLLARVRPHVTVLDDISRFLEDCDQVKFAGIVPPETECVTALTRGRTIVESTIPSPKPRSAAPPTTEGGPDAAPPGEPDETLVAGPTIGEMAVASQRAATADSSEETSPAPQQPEPDPEPDPDLAPAPEPEPEKSEEDSASSESDGTTKEET